MKKLKYPAGVHYHNAYMSLVSRYSIVIMENGYYGYYVAIAGISKNIESILRKRNIPLDKEEFIVTRKMYDACSRLFLYEKEKYIEQNNIEIIPLN